MVRNILRSVLVVRSMKKVENHCNRALILNNNRVYESYRLKEPNFLI